MKKVAKITQEELKAAGVGVGSMPTSVYNAKKLKAENENKKVYIGQLSDKDIETFFAPLGYAYHMKNENVNGGNEPFIIVVCDNYTIMFNDFTTRVYDEGAISSNSFYAPENDEFAKRLRNYEELTNTPIGKLISDAIAIDFLGKKFSETYPQKKKAFDEANLKSAYKQLTAEQKKFFASAKEMQEANIVARLNMNAYGKANIEDELRNS